jgi:F0F1-type ATP synthase membrane subunit b/b'
MQMLNDTTTNNMLIFIGTIIGFVLFFIVLITWVKTPSWRSSSERTEYTECLK